MSYEIQLRDGVTEDAVLAQLEQELKDAEAYQRRRHPHWEENYDLYRLSVKRNKLVQRQAVCVPLVKETVRTILSRIADDSEVRFYSRSGDADRNIVMNKLAEYISDTVRFPLLDVMEKKSELLYGRGHIKLNITKDKTKPLSFEVKRPYDVLVDPFCDPADLETARYIVERNVLRTIEQIEANPAFSKEAVQKLKQQLEQNSAQREPVGVDSKLNKVFTGLVELRLHYTTIKGTRYYCVVANGVLLQAQPLEDVLGVEFFPFEGWADDLEEEDYWSDAVADIVRDANKAINVLYSQFLENRSLRSFGMYFYNSTTPMSKTIEWQPKPFGFYPVPGNPRDMLLPVEIPELPTVERDIQFITNIVERATAATAIEKGVLEDTKRTLGEVQIAVGNAMRRLNSITLYHREARRRLWQKAYELLRNSPLTTLTLYQLDSDGNLVPKEVSRSEWVDDKGYEVVVQPRDASVVEKMQKLQVLQYALQVIQNPRAQRILQEELVDLLDLYEVRAEELRNILSEGGVEQLLPQAPQPPALTQQPQEPDQPLV